MIQDLKPTTKRKIVAGDLEKLSYAQANTASKEVFIYEISDMTDLIGKDTSEEIRKKFIKNEIRVKEITNNSTVSEFSKNDIYTNQVMTFRYVPEEIYKISDEVVIFDDIVAFYNMKEICIIQDQNFAEREKQLFASIWDQGQSPKLDFPYKPNHSFYKSFDHSIGDKQVIIWPDAEAANAYGEMSQQEISQYLENIITSDKFFEDATYIIIFIWSMDGERVSDIWKFSKNNVDDRSGPLSDVRVYKEGKICEKLGLASGNTLIVLGYEEKLRRQSEDLNSYLAGPPPTLPLEVVNGRDFFTQR